MKFYFILFTTFLFCTTGLQAQFSLWDKVGNNSYNTNLGGNIGIGTPFPQERLDINGNTRVAGGLWALGRIGIGTTSPLTKLHITNGDDASPVLHGYMMLGSVTGLNIVIDDNEIMARNNGAVADLFLNVEGGDVRIGSDIKSDLYLKTGASVFVGGNTHGGFDGLRVHQDLGNGYIDHKGTGSLNFRVDNSVGSTTRMSIASTGNLTVDGGSLFVDAVNNRVGIGTTGPAYPLDVLGNTRMQGTLTVNQSDRSFYTPGWAPGGGVIHAGVFDGQGNGPQLRFTGVAGGAFMDIGNDASGNFVIENGFDIEVLEMQQDGDLSVDGSSLFVDASANRVGIGTTSPGYPLQVIGGDVKIGSTAGDNRKLYFGDASYVYVGEGPTDDDLILRGGLTSIMGGNVGIGTSTPTKGKLEVSGTAAYNFTLCRGFGHANIGTGECFANYAPATQYWGVSIYATSLIVSNMGFGVDSDIRIKDIIGVSQSLKDLKTLKNIEITDYQMKDKIAIGNRQFKKVIAQQVKEVFPLAVSFSTNEVPDIYQMATLENGWVASATDLKAGETVQLIFDTEKELFEVLETSPSGFRVDTERTGDVFVYGRQVDDFHTVDYDAISMLNVSATQEVAKQMERLQAENLEQAARISKLEKQLEDLNMLKADMVKLQGLLQNNTANNTSGNPAQGE